MLHSRTSLLLAISLIVWASVQVSATNDDVALHRQRRKDAASWLRNVGVKSRSVAETIRSVASFSFLDGSSADNNDDAAAAGIAGYDKDDAGEAPSFLESLTRQLQRAVSPQPVGLPMPAKVSDRAKVKQPSVAHRRSSASTTRLATGVLPSMAATGTVSPTSTGKLQRRQFGSLATTSTPLATARSAIYTAASQIISILPTATTTNFCNDGNIGVELSSATKFICTDTAGVNTTRDAYYYQSAPKDARANCTYVDGTSPQGRQCLCSSDYLLFRTRPTFFGCLPKNFTCATTLLGLNSCRLPGYAEPEPDMNACYSLSRSPTGTNGAVGNWRLSIECSIESYINPAIYEALGAVTTSPTNATAVWVPIGIAVDNSNGQQPTGTFADLAADTALFPAAFDVLIAQENATVVQASQPPSGSTRLHLTTRHPLVTYGTLEVQFFDFNEPSRTDGGARVIVPLVVDNATGPSGMGAGVLTDASSGRPFAALSLLATSSRIWNISYDISTLPDHYFFGGRLYMEVGLLSPFGLVSRYSVAGLEIEILDTPPSSRTYSYSNKLSTSTIAIIAVACACAGFIILVIAWKLWRLPPQEDVSVVGGRIRRAESLSNVKKNK